MNMPSTIFENPKNLYLISLVIFFWALPWKAWALWRSARKGQPVWFLALLIIQSAAILDLLYILLFSRDRERKEEIPSKNIQKVAASSAHNLQNPKMVL